MKILFVHNYLASFTKIDLEILRSAHEVQELYIGRATASQLVREHARISAGVEWADLVFAWFGGYHALLPFTLAKIRGRKCVVVASGYDVANMPEICYGNMRPGLRRLIGMRVFALADRVLAVSEYTRAEAMRNAGVAQHKIEVVVHGFDTQYFHTSFSEQRREQILTVSRIAADTLVRKGLDHFAAAAAALNDTSFILVGTQAAGATQLLDALTPNVRLTGRLPDSELLEIMRQDKTYVQLSAHEAFGMAVAEAMLCGCVPVVSDRGALPEVVGDAGYIVPYGNLPATVAAIKESLTASPTAGERARQRIVERFPLERRRQALLKIVQSLKPV